jgi:hypothetical protein
MKPIVRARIWSTRYMNDRRLWHSEIQRNGKWEASVCNAPSFEETVRFTCFYFKQITAS